MTETQTDSGGQDAAVESQIEQESTTHPAPEASEGSDSTPTDEGQAPTTPATEPEGSKPETEEQQKAPQKKKSGGFQRKIDRLSNENAQLAAQLQKLQQPQSQTPEEKPAGRDPDKEPVLTDFDDVLDFIDAKAEWKAKQAVKTYDETKAQQAKEQATQEEYKTKVNAYIDRLQPLTEADPELEQKIEAYEKAGLVTKYLESAVLDSPIGEKITQHLVNNPQDLQVLAGMNEAQTYKAIGMLELMLGNRNQNPNGQQAAVRTTSAAPPIKPIGKQASTAVKPLPEMSQEEIERWRYPDRKLS